MLLLIFFSLNTLYFIKIFDRSAVTAASIIYNIVFDFVKEMCPVQKDNQAGLHNQFKVYEKIFEFPGVENE